MVYRFFVNLPDVPYYFGDSYYEKMMIIFQHLSVCRRYPKASEKELNDNCDNCAICWEKMEVARKLPCKHLFHT